MWNMLQLTFFCVMNFAFILLPTGSPLMKLGQFWPLLPPPSMTKYYFTEQSSLWHSFYIFRNREKMVTFPNNNRKEYQIWQDQLLRQARKGSSFKLANPRLHPDNERILQVSASASASASDYHHDNDHDFQKAGGWTSATSRSKTGQFQTVSISIASF